MKTSCILGAALAAATILAGSMSCTRTQNTTADIDIKGDLALLQLQGDVSSMIMDGETYLFDEQGRLKVEGARDTVNAIGQNCIIYDTYDEDYMHGPTRPYMRIYDDRGRLQEVWTYFSSVQQLEYGEGGLPVSMKWGDEGYSGKEDYTYTDGVLTLCENHDYGFDEEQDEASTSDIIAYDVDTKGNWTRRFIIVRSAEELILNSVLQEREIHYYSGESVMDTKRSKLLLSGSLDGEDLVLGFRQLAPIEDNFCAFLLYRGSVYGADNLSYDFPSLKMVVYSLDGGDEYTLDGTLSADPGKSADVTFTGTLSSSYGTQTAVILNR